MSETITGADLRAVVAVIEDGHRDEPTAGVPWSVLEGLAGLVPCDLVTLPEGDFVRGRQILFQAVDADGVRDLLVIADPDGTVGTDPEVIWKGVRDFAPCSYGERTGDFARVTRFTDFYSERQLRDIPLIADWWGPAGGRYGMCMSLLACVPAHRRKICFWRSSGPDFTDRERQLVELLRPHIWEIYNEGRQRREPLPHLTPREWEVLRLADQGLGNAEIAETLYLSVATVRKHFENIFDRTGVRTRAAAAAKMLPPYR
jgi:DNA-binding CsgD family transcriptional regulator